MMKRSTPGTMVVNRIQNAYVTTKRRSKAPQTFDECEQLPEWMNARAQPAIVPRKYMDDGDVVEFTSMDGLTYAVVVDETGKYWKSLLYK